MAQKMLWLLLTLFAILSYLSEIRTYVLTNFGKYFAGTLDGVVLTMIVLTIALYVKSLRRL